MCLVGPGDVGGGDQDGGQLPLAGEMQQFMNSPVLEHEAQAEHEHAQGIVDDFGSDLLLPGAGPDPAQQDHGKAIDRP